MVDEAGGTGSKQRANCRSACIPSLVTPAATDPAGNVGAAFRPRSEPGACPSGRPWHVTAGQEM